MTRNAIASMFLTLSFAIGMALGKQPFDAAIATAATPHASTVQVRDLQPFAHLARIPADADPSTIRLEGVKMVQVPTRIVFTSDSRYCEQLAFRAGGSMYCPSMQPGSWAPAYEVSYSYLGQPLASDEYGGRKFTFQVYFRPEELGPQVRQALAERKRDRPDLAQYFKLNVLHELVQRIVIDEEKSHFCDGNFVDGTWTRSDPRCKDQIYTTAIASPSDYITLRVDPVSAEAGLVLGGTVGRLSGGK